MPHTSTKVTSGMLFID